MATPSQVRAALGTLLSTVTGLNVVTYPAESAPAARPALVVGEGTAMLAEGDRTLGLDTWRFPLLVLVSSGDYPSALADLDEYLVRSGAKSVRQVITDHSGLDFDDGTYAYFAEIEEYGPRESADGQRMAGAVLVLVVRTAS